jgi:hypothetical protein
MRLNVDTRIESGVLPRKYRPPAKRRKLKTRPLGENLGHPPVAAPVEAPEQEAEGEEEFAKEAVQAAPTAAAAVRITSPSRGEGKHIVQDYSYVRAEIVRMALAGGFIMISLILTAVFLR